MRILTVSNCPARAYLGSGYVVSNFVKGLRILGHEVDLLEPDDCEIWQRMRPRANSYRQTVGIGMYVATRPALFESYDLVEFWGGEAWLATRWLSSRKPALRPLIVQHTNGPEPRYNALLAEAGLRKLSYFQDRHAAKLIPMAFTHADAVVTVSEYDKEWLIAHCLPRSGKILAIENPLPDCFLGRPEKDSGLFIIGFCGTWLPKKGIGVLVPDITRILREFPEWRFRVLGADHRTEVQECFPSDIRQRIEVKRMITEKEELAREYDKIEIFVLPSLIESFGVALAEAMACRCAVVTTRVGLGASLMDGKHALLLDKPESPKLYESIKRLIMNPELRQQLGNAGWERVQCLRWEDAVKTLSAAYEEWSAEHRRVLAEA